MRIAEYFLLLILLVFPALIIIKYTRHSHFNNKKTVNTAFNR